MASNSKIRNCLLYLSESVNQIDISEDEINIVTVKRFVHILEDIEDFRVKGRCIYKLENLIIMIFFAILSGHGSNCIDIADYVSLNKNMFIRWEILSESDETPSHDTFRRLLMNLDTNNLKKVVYRYLNDFFKKIEEMMSNSQYRQLSIDGKELRGTGRHKDSDNSKGNIATLNIYDHTNGLILSSDSINKKDSEIVKAREKLELLNLEKTIVTCDAIHCQKKTAQLIHNKHGYYVLRVKDNQESLSKDIEDRINSKKKVVKYIKTDTRDFYFYSLPSNYIGLEWPGQKTYIKVISHTRKTDEPANLYFISNCSNKQLMIEAIENRWQIENDHHKNKDYLLDEDKFRISNNIAVENIVALNDIVLAFIKITFALMPELKTLKKTRMAFELQPEKYLMMLLSLIDSDVLIDKLKELKKNKK